jgi:hypothetical protein
LEVSAKKLVAGSNAATENEREISAKKRKSSPLVIASASGASGMISCSQLARRP